MNIYNNDFYESRHERTLHSATTILSLVREIVPNIASAVDVGCGVGTWLSVLKGDGVNDVLGLDGTWVKSDHLVIPKSLFVESDLKKPLEVQRKYDLAISLEVAEHLPPESSDTFVRSLTELSDHVLFSAAIPGQGGVCHINEQWPDYWSTRFSKCGFVSVDAIRPAIWNDSSIPFWYRQNCVLYSKRERLAELELDSNTVTGIVIPYVHPELLEKLQSKANELPTIRQAARLLLSAIKRRCARIIRLGGTKASS